jgi:quercetin dioxygenase-like cupin family protein
MQHPTLPHRRRAPVLAAGLAFALAGFVAPAAQAGQCPADKVVANSNRAIETKPLGVTDTVLQAIDLAQQPAAIQGRQLRLRRLVVQPGGVVPWHSHGNRPAIIYIVEGEITEYASTCAVPILHKAGEATTEIHPTEHWWKNTASRPVTLLSADFFPVVADPHMM